MRISTLWSLRGARLFSNLSRQSSHGRATVWALAGATTALVAVVAMVAVRWNWDVQYTRQAKLRESLLAEAAAMPTAPPPTVDARAAWIAALPTQIDDAHIVHALSEEAATQGVVVSSVTLTPRQASASNLPGVDVTVEANGPYPALRQVLTAMLDRFPHAVLVDARWRRQAAPTDIAASWRFTFASRPALASGR